MCMFIYNYINIQTHVKIHVIFHIILLYIKFIFTFLFLFIFLIFSPESFLQKLVNVLHLPSGNVELMCVSSLSFCYCSILLPW